MRACTAQTFEIVYGDTSAPLPKVFASSQVRASERGPCRQTFGTEEGLQSVAHLVSSHDGRMHVHWVVGVGRVREGGVTEREESAEPLSGFAAV